MKPKLQFRLHLRLKLNSSLQVANHKIQILKSSCRKSWATLITSIVLIAKRTWAHMLLSGSDYLFAKPVLRCIRSPLVATSIVMLKKYTMNHGMTISSDRCALVETSLFSRSWRSMTVTIFRSPTGWSNPACYGTRRDTWLWWTESPLTSRKTQNHLEIWRRELSRWRLRWRMEPASPIKIWKAL